MTCIKRLLVFTFLLGISPGVFAEETPVPNPEGIELVLEQLDSPSFSQRQEAYRKLQRMGVSAIEVLGESITDSSAERASRLVEILKKFYESSDQEANERAKEVLEKLAKRSDGIALIAKRLLNPPQEPNLRPIPRQVIVARPQVRPILPQPRFQPAPQNRRPAVQPLPKAPPVNPKLARIKGLERSLQNIERNVEVFKSKLKNPAEAEIAKKALENLEKQRAKIAKLKETAEKELP
ncbi:MAG: hypothetical protein AAFU85_01310 [Planctomycetota bacterium]